MTLIVQNFSDQILPVPQLGDMLFDDGTGTGRKISGVLRLPPGDGIAITAAQAALFDGNTFLRVVDVTPKTTTAKARKSA